MNSETKRYEVRELVESLPAGFPYWRQVAKSSTRSGALMWIKRAKQADKTRKLAMFFTSPRENGNEQSE